MVAGGGGGGGRGEGVGKAERVGEGGSEVGCFIFTSWFNGAKCSFSSNI